ncbi:MAG: XrtA/PEP-CTERM system TPR-repeat protein PrsT [Pseudomonadota bacterium]
MFRKRQAGKVKPALILALIAVVAIAVVSVVLIRGRLDPAAELAKAKEAIETTEYQTAAIVLKSLAQAQPDNVEARLLLGDVYLRVGDVKGALKEFERARALGSASETGDLGYVRALILNSKFDEASAELEDRSNSVDWQNLRGMLAFGQLEFEAATEIFNDVLASEAENEEALRGLLQTHLAVGNREAAREQLDRLLTLHPTGTKLLLIKGRMDAQENDFEAALEAFRGVLEKDESNIDARLGLVEVLIKSGDTAAADTELAAFGSAGESDARVQYLRARNELERGDQLAALDSLRKVLRLVPMNRQSLALAAEIHFERREFASARDYARDLVELEPTNQAAQRVLAAVEMASGRLEGLDGAVDVLLNDDSVRDPGMLALLGTAYLKQGKLEESEQSLARAAEMLPDSAEIRTQLAISKMTRGKLDEARADLEAVVAESDSTRAKIALVLLESAAEDREAAEQRLEVLAAERPEDPVVPNLHGYILEQLGELDGAGDYYRAALSLDKAFHPASVNLARLASEAGDNDVAKAHLQDILDIEKDHPAALMGLASLALRDGETQEAAKLWERIRQTSRDAAPARLMLARHYRTAGDLNAANEAIDEAFELVPYATGVLAERVAIKAQVSAFDEALESANSLVATNPQSVEYLEMLASVQNQIGDENGLKETLTKIVEIEPDSIISQVLLGRLAIKNEDYAAANRTAQELLLNEDSAAAAYELQGDIARAQGDGQGAVDAYARAFELVPNNETLLKLDAQEHALGKPMARLSKWLEDNPDDLAVRLVHATRLQEDGSSDAALGEYERMIEAEEQNPIVLNNLAWMYFERGDDRAIEVARQAHDLAPNLAEVADTYGWILVKQGQVEQGMEILDRAHDASPDNPDIAFHLAGAMAAAGQRARARQKIEDLVAEEPEFYSRGEAMELLEELKAAR